jgi:2-dehydro-3-deoxygluconokinase
MKKFDIVALGEPLYELNQQPDGLFLPGFGGDTSNVTIAAARLGAKCAYITKLGQDPFGDAIVSLWRTEGVDAGAVCRHPTAQTGIYLVTHGDAGHGFSYFRKGSAASLMTPDDVPERLIAESSWLHVSGISQAISASAADAVTHAIAVAKRSHTRVSYDTNLRLRLWTKEAARPVIEATAAEADILKTSLDDAEVMLGFREVNQVTDHFLRLGSRAVIVTLGADGVLAAVPERRERIGGHKVQAVDATGAGDAFAGALLAEISHGRDFFAAARFANAAAALSTTGYGAVKPLPRRADVEALLHRAAGIDLDRP